MIESNIAHFDQVKEQNRRIIRNLLMETPGVGKTELASLSGLTFPTVSSAIKDLIASGEVLERSKTSNGGRPGAVFELNGEFQYTLCAYIYCFAIHIRIYDACKMICEESEIKIAADIEPKELVEVFKQIKKKYPAISVLSLGVPGVVLDGIIKYLPNLREIEGFDLGKSLEEELDVKVFIENDVNAMVLAEKNRYRDLAHIIIENGCIGTGIMINGQLIRGAHGSAGELEYICEKKSDNMEILIQGIRAIICVIDVADIAVSGIDVDENMISQLKDSLGELLPAARIPNIHIISDLENLYYRGLLYSAIEYCRNC